MAREWALRGLNEEELRPDPKIQAPKTPKGKLENFWYHYKWHTIGGLAAAVVLTVLIGQLVTRDNPDYTVLLATQNYTGEAAVAKLESALEACGRDIDQDGKVEVQIDSISFSSDSQTGMASQYKLIAHLSAGDVMFFIIDKETYESKIVAQETGDYQFFSPVGVQADGIEGGGLYWNWKNSDLRKDAAFKGMPEDLYFGVRGVSGTSAKKESKKMNEQCMELLQAFLTKKPLTAATTAAK